MRKIILIGLSSVLLPYISMAMEDPVNMGCHQRHAKAHNATSPHISSKEELTPSEKNFIIGLKYFKEDKFKECIECFIASSKYNNENAEYNLGVIYEHGVSDEFPINLEKAEYWYNKAKDHGHIKAKEALKRVKKEENQGWFSFSFW